MKNKISAIIIFLISLLGFVFLWKLVIYVFNYPEYILPQPEKVIVRLWEMINENKLGIHFRRTMVEVFSGFGLGFFSALGLGYLLAKKKWLKISVTPYLVAFQAIPIVALAPIIILWFGTGIISKIIICALIVFFPVMVNTVAAISNMKSEHLELMKTFNSNSWQKFIYLEFPSSLPYFFSSLKIGFILALVGAIVGEFIGADRGLGFLINVSLGLIDTVQLFSVILILALIGMFFYLGINLLEKHFKRSY